MAIKMRLFFFIWVITILILLVGCSAPSGPTDKPAPIPSPEPTPVKSRAETIPANAVKVTPATDVYPPQLHSTEYQLPVPLSSGVNTAGAEDSAFVLPDGTTLYFFFTPDVTLPPEKQLLDGVTGIWVSRKMGNEWSQAERVLLQDSGELALDGCVFVQGTEMWFGSARKGNYRGVDIWTAQFRDGRWTDWQNAGKKLNVDYEVGEFHITADGSEMYFHSPRAGGRGGYDIWVIKKLNGEWQAPVNIAEVNTPDTDGWPFVTRDGKELWFTRTYKGSPAVFRSKQTGDSWSEPELIISQFAAEPSLDSAGNVYFATISLKTIK